MSSSSSSLFSFKPSVADIKVKEVKKEIEDAKNEEKYLQIKLDQIDDKIKIEKSKIDADNKLLTELEEDRQMIRGSLKSISSTISSLHSRYQHLLSIPGSFKSQEAKPSKSEGDLLMELAPAPKNPSPPPSPGLISHKVTHVEATAGKRMFWKEIRNIVTANEFKFESDFISLEHSTWLGAFPFPSESGHGQTLFVRPCYKEVWDILWDKYNKPNSYVCAAIIGTPGIGMILFFFNFFTGHPVDHYYYSVVSHKFQVFNYILYFYRVFYNVNREILVFVLRVCSYFTQRSYCLHYIPAPG